MLDRIDWTDASISQPVVTDLDPRSFLLTPSEVERLKEDFHILMSRYRSSKCRVRSQRKACCARVLVMRMKNEFSHEWKCSMAYSKSLSATDVNQVQNGKPDYLFCLIR